MQENVKFITIRTENAINSVQDLKNYIKDLQDVLVNTEKDTDEYNATIEKLVVSQEKLNDVMAATKKNADAAEGSYNSLVNKMAALKTAWRATTSEVQRAQLGEKINEINEQLKAYDATIGNHQRKVGSYEQALSVLTKEFTSQKQELSALKTALDNLEPGSDAYNEAFTRAAEITHNLQERQQELRMSANDLGTQLGNVANIGAGLVGGFNAVNAIMTLTGQKNENLQKSMVKLQAGIALVQGLKGIEGATKALKGYANWATKAYDRIANLVSGKKAEQKQIDATTKSTNANTTANNQNAISEKNAAAGATQLSAGMKSTAVSTSVATKEMIAFKAVIMSLGIGVAIALISGLVAGINKLIHASDEAYDKALEHARTQLDLEDALRELKDKAQEEAWAIEEAAGENGIALAKKKYDYYSERVKKYEKELEGIASAEESWAGKVHKALSWGKGSAAVKQIEKDSKLEFATIMAELERMADSGNRYIMGLGEDTLATFKRVREEGLKTAKDIYVIFDIYKNASAQQVVQDRENASQYLTDLKVRATSTVKAAQDAVSSETQILKAGYEADVKALNEYYDTVGATETARKQGLQALEDAHRKKMWDIITGATQSVVDSAHQANLTELEQLEEKYQKEYKLLKQYGRSTVELTKAYQKEKAQLIFNGEVKATEDAIKELDRFVQESGPLKKVYDELQAAGVAYAKDLAKAQDEEYQTIQFSLEQQFKYWTEMWNKYKNDEKLTQEQRLDLQAKYLNAKNALEKNETDYLLKQIKTRKQALDEQIEAIEKNYSNVSKMQSLNTEHKYSQYSGFGDTFWGARQNASFGQMKADLNESYGIDKTRLNEEIAYYQEFANKIAQTDAERTYAQQKEAEKRMELATLERENMIENLRLEIDEQKELINTITDVGNSITSILGSVADAWEDNLNTQVRIGKMSQAEADKEMENVRALQIVQATINMLAGSFGAFAQASETIPPPYGQIVGAAAAAAVIAQGIAQIAAIRNAGKTGNASGGSTMMAQVTPVMVDYQPQMVGTATGEQETEQLANAIQGANIWVSVTDIDNAQERGRVRVSESSY